MGNFHVWKREGGRVGNSPACNPPTPESMAKALPAAVGKERADTPCSTTGAAQILDGAGYIC